MVGLKRRIDIPPLKQPRPGHGIMKPTLDCRGTGLRMSGVKIAKPMPQASSSQAKLFDIVDENAKKKLTLRIIRSPRLIAQAEACSALHKTIRASDRCVGAVCPAPKTRRLSADIAASQETPANVGDAPHGQASQAASVQFLPHKPIALHPLSVSICFRRRTASGTCCEQQTSSAKATKAERLRPRPISTYSQQSVINFISPPFNNAGRPPCKNSRYAPST